MWSTVSSRHHSASPPPARCCPIYFATEVIPRNIDLTYLHSYATSSYRPGLVYQLYSGYFVHTLRKLMFFHVAPRYTSLWYTSLIGTRTLGTPQNVPYLSLLRYVSTSLSAYAYDMSYDTSINTARCSSVVLAGIQQTVHVSVLQDSKHTELTFRRTVRSSRGIEEVLLRVRRGRGLHNPA